MDNVTFTRVAARPGQHATSDRRTPTRYEVLVDGVKVGEVWTRSTESWRSDASTSRIKYGFRGYSRTWAVNTADGTSVTKCAHSRDWAVKRLLDHLATTTDPRN